MNKCKVSRSESNNFSHMAKVFLQTTPTPQKTHSIHYLQALVLALQNVIPITAGTEQDASRQAHNWTKQRSTCVESKLLWSPTRDAHCRLSAYGVSGFITWRQSVRSIRLAPAVLKNSACGNVKRDMRRRAWRNEICARSVSAAGTAMRRRRGKSQCIKENIKPNAIQLHHSNVFKLQFN
jgi:hypothetical protein